MRFSKPINFYPGVDEWFTFNVYSGINLLDSLLKKIYSGVEYLIESGVLRSFFFVRYRDPDFHLRLRFRLSDPKDIGTVTDFLFNSLKPLLLDNIIWRTTLTGYSREIHRYGIFTIEIIEDIFAKSSIITLRNLEEFPERSDLAIVYLNVIFDLMDFTIGERASFCKRVKESFFNEFHFDKQTKSVLRVKFSMYYDRIDRVFHDSNSQIYLSYKTALSDTFEKLKGLMNLYPSAAVDHILTSIIHMEFNRIFISGGREKEAIIYYVLDRYYARRLNQKRDTNAN